jgi:hypothetical protein
MAEIELRSIHLHWLENGDPFTDLCVHGGIYLRIGDFVISDGTDLDWTVSTAAFNLLRTLFQDQPLIGREPLIPHCGFTMWPSNSEPDGLYIPNCDIGINWSLKHEPGRLIHEFANGTRVITNIKDWKLAVCQFADEVDVFLHSAWPKAIDDEQDRRGFEHFISVWQMRRLEADLIDGNAKIN